MVAKRKGVVIPVNPSTPGMRASRPGPEVEMIRAAEIAGLFTTRGGKPVVFREPSLPTGFPDLVAVYPSRKASANSSSPSALTVDHLRILHHLYSHPSSTIDDVSSTLCWSARETRAIVGDLQSANIIQAVSDCLVANELSRVFRVRRIVAIEAKMRDWRSALDQATGNTWFASHSYILIPERASYDSIIAESAMRGVGIFSFDGSSVREVFPARSFPIPASYGSWLFNEWLSSHMNGG